MFASLNLAQGIPLNVCTGSLRIRLVIIYQLPHSINHPMTVNSFIAEFSEYLESVILSNDLLCLTGDFNVHVDDHNDPAACRFKVGCVSFRKLRSMDRDAFMDEIRNSELFQMDTDDPDELAALFDNTLCSLLDHHALVKHKNTTSQPCVPWMNDEIKLAKRQRRKAERKWRASKAHIDLLSYRTMRNRVMFLSNKVRSDYYTNFITENSTDQRRLFRASKSLLNLSKGSGLPLSTNDYQLANDLENSSPKKLLISGLLIQTRSAFRPINATSTVTASCFSEFNLLSESEVFHPITASSKKSCPLDPIPTKFLNECVDVLLPLITKIINLSLDSGYFPHTCKCALVRPVLKKDGLPPVFRPVSNLAFISKLFETGCQATTTLFKL